MDPRTPLHQRDLFDTAYQRAAAVARSPQIRPADRESALSFLAQLAASRQPPRSIRTAAASIVRQAAPAERSA